MSNNSLQKRVATTSSSIHLFHSQFYNIRGYASINFTFIFVENRLI